MNWQKFKDKIEEKRTERDLAYKPLYMIKDLGRIIKRFLQEDYYSVAILEKQKAVCFFVAKVASTSLEKVFSAEIPYKLTEEELHGRYKNYTKFAFVRNPYDKMVSAYFHLVGDPPNNSRKFLNGMYRELWRYNGKFWPKMSFKDFVKAVHSIPDNKSFLKFIQSPPEKKINNHLISQTAALTDKEGNLIPEHIGKYENLEEDYRKICKKIGMEKPPKPPTLNKSKKRKRNYKDYYDEETKQLVKERYRKDLEIFDYSFE